jgi:heat shock protein HtpX
MKHRIKNQITTVALLGTLSSIFVVTGLVLLHSISGAIVGLCFAGLINFTAWYYSDFLSLAAFFACPASAEQEPEFDSIEILTVPNCHYH